MGNRLYVGNLPLHVDEEQIHNLFSEVGEVVSVTIITDRETGRSKGFGFVEMASEETASEAIKRFNGYSLDDRQLNVDQARPKRDSDRGGRPDRRQGRRRDRF